MKKLTEGQALEVLDRLCESNIDDMYTLYKANHNHNMISTLRKIYPGNSDEQLETLHNYIQKNHPRAEEYDNIAKKLGLKVEESLEESELVEDKSLDSLAQSIGEAIEHADHSLDVAINRNTITVRNSKGDTSSFTARKVQTFVVEDNISGAELVSSRDKKAIINDAAYEIIKDVKD